MSHDKIGPKEKALRELREQRFAKPTATKLRERIAKIKPVRNMAKRKGR